MPQLPVTIWTKFGEGGHHRSIATALIATTGLLFVAKLVGLAKEMMVAFHFGTTTVASVYALAFLLALWPVGLWTSVSGNVLIPLLVRFDDDGGRASARFRNELFGLSLLVGLLTSGAMYGVFHFGVSAHLLTLSPDAARLLGQTAIAFAAMTAVGLLNSQLTSQLLASRNPIVSLLDGIPSFCVLVCLAIPTWRGPWPLVLGTLIGFLVQTCALILAHPADIRLGWPRLSFSSSAWPAFWGGVRVLIVSQTLLAATGVIDQVAMTRLGHGANATLGYANRIVLLATSLIGLALSRAILPVLARVSDDRQRTWSLSVTWASALLGIALVASAVLGVLAPWIVRILFQRGSFTWNDTAAVASALRMGLLQLPFFCASMVLAQYVSATQRYHLFLWGNGLNLIVKIIANAIFIPALGVPGALLSTAIMYATSAAFLWVAGRPGRAEREASTRTI